MLLCVCFFLNVGCTLRLQEQQDTIPRSILESILKKKSEQEQRMHRLQYLNAHFHSSRLKVLRTLFLTFLPQLAAFTLVSCVRVTVTIVLLAIQNSCTILLAIVQWMTSNETNGPGITR